MQRFARTLTQRLLFDNRAEDATPFLAKFALRSKQSHGLRFLENDARADPTQRENFKLLDMYVERTKALLRQVAESSEHRSLVSSQRVNFRRTDASFLRRLMHDSSITIKPADKNLGLVLVDTAWYHRELSRMLSDTVTYKKFPGFRIGERATRIQCSFAQLQTHLLKQLAKLRDTHKRALTLWNPHYADAVLKYLGGAVTDESCVLPTIYLLIKVHKASGLCGRPIVPSSRWLTTPASVVADHLLQEIFTAARIPHIVKDTKSLVAELERTPLLHRDGVFVTADIASLYTNIDTSVGLGLVNSFLHEQHVSEAHQRLIMDLVTFVMNNSYLQFDGVTYHQIDGTAMGTATAPVYANIVVYMLEKPVVDDMQRDRHVLHMYHRFLDDLFAFIARSAAAEFMARMNRLHPKLRFEFVQSESEAAFLDLRIHKGDRFAASGVFDLSVHQKKMNLYLYIPYNSFHTDAMKRGFIQTELMRYIRNCSDRTEYARIKNRFYQRLRDRGYPHEFLQPIFRNIFYADRPYFLHPAASLHEHPLLQSRPPLSQCLQRRLSRLQTTQLWSSDRRPVGLPPVFIIPYSPVSRLLPTRSLLSRHWDTLLAALSHAAPRPIIAYQSHASLMATLVYKRAANFERQRREAANAERPQPTASATQSHLQHFFHAAHSTSRKEQQLDQPD